MIGTVLKHILDSLIYFIQICLDGLFEIVNFYIEVADLPRISDDVLLLSATQLADQIRKRKISAEAVMKSFIKRIEDVNPFLNCFVGGRYEEAIQEAKEVDRLLETCPNAPEISAKEKPFLGVPFTAKECLQIKGLPNPCGLVSLKGRLAPVDAQVAQRLKEAGSIALGVTSVPELAMWWETSNNLYGTTKNPYDSRRMVGGSSGGEGCLISAGGSVWGIGGDIAGSIRMPAFYNGIFGHKPSRFLLPTEGLYPPNPNKGGLCTTGPMCRYAEDMMPMLKIMAGPEKTKLLDLDTPVDLQSIKLKVFSAYTIGNAFSVTPVVEELLAVQRHVEDFLQGSVNAEVEHKAFDEMKDAYAMWNSVLSLAGSTPFVQHMGLPSDQPINPLRELFLWLFGQSDHTFPAILVAFLGKMSSSTEIKKMYAAQAEDLESHINDMLGDTGILLFPSSADYAYYHHQPIYKFLNPAYTFIFNVLGNPVTQVPLGLGRKGVPLGIQVVAAHNNDRLAIAIGQLLEKQFAGWVEPCPRRS